LTAHTINREWRENADQAETIARATLGGFLESDLVPSGMQAPALIWAAAFLVTPALCLPAVHMVKYQFIRRYQPELVERALWNDRLLFLLLSAGAMGLIAVVLWDTLFPARRDAFVLTPMPIPLGVQMVGPVVRHAQRRASSRWEGRGRPDLLLSAPSIEDPSAVDRVDRHLPGLRAFQRRQSEDRP